MFVNPARRLGSVRSCSSTIPLAAPPVFRETEPPGWLVLWKASRPARRDAVEWSITLSNERMPKKLGSKKAGPLAQELVHPLSLSSATGTRAQARPLSEPNELCALKGLWKAENNYFLD